MAMEFEYGCQTANKYMFFEENEVEDPSELLAQVTKKEEAPKAKVPAGKAGAKTDVKGKPTSAKDTKKPLQQQQQTENKLAGRGQQKGGQRPTSAAQPPREDKENTSNRPQGERRPQVDRRPRQEGEGGEYRPRPERRGPRPEGEGPRTDRPPRRYPPRQPPAEGEVQQGGDEDGKQVRRGPGASGRAGFRFRRANDTHQRDFDRHSGSDRTGVKAVDKREGAGKANWGTPQDELAGNEEAQQAVAEETKAEETGDWAARVEESEEKKEEETKDEQSTFMTLAEYKALQNAVNKRNEFNIRKPGEGEDQTKWGKAYVLKKKVEEEEEAEEEEEEEEEADEEEEKRRQLLNQIQIKFNEPATTRGGPGRGGRGGRGGFRGEPRRPEVAPTGETPSAEQSPEKRAPSGRGGPRGGQGRGPQGGRGGYQPKVVVPKIEDEQDFPTLGK